MTDDVLLKKAMQYPQRQSQSTRCKGSHR